MTTPDPAEIVTVSLCALANLQGAAPAKERPSPGSQAAIERSMRKLGELSDPTSSQPREH